MLTLNVVATPQSKFWLAFSAFVTLIFSRETLANILIT